MELIKGNTYTVNGLAGYRFDFACYINAGRTRQFWFSNGYFTQSVIEDRVAEVVK